MIVLKPVFSLLCFPFSNEGFRLNVSLDSVSSSSFDCVWSVSQGSLGQMQVTAVSNTPTGLPVLSVLPNRLLPGTTYTFRVDVTMRDSGATGFATLDVELNSIPRSGKIEVSPSEGRALSTKFTVTALNWIDEPGDLPLRCFACFLSRNKDFESQATSRHLLRSRPIRCAPFFSYIFAVERNRQPVQGLGPSSFSNVAQVSFFHRLWIIPPHDHVFQDPAAHSRRELRLLVAPSDRQLWC